MKIHQAPKDIQDFFSSEPWTQKYWRTQMVFRNIDKVQDFEHPFQFAQWVVRESGWPYLPIELPNAPYKEMLKEAKALYNEGMFTMHRNDFDKVDEYYFTSDHFREKTHRGWGACTIYGEAYNKTGHPESGNFDNYDWCPEIVERCPETYRYFRDEYPETPDGRIRFMLVDRQGYIQPHQDRTENILAPINIALNNPTGCEFRMEHKGYVPFENGGSACFVDIGNKHSVWNRSNLPRFHIIAHGKPKPEMSDIIIKSLRKLIGGKYD